MVLRRISEGSEVIEETDTNRRLIEGITLDPYTRMVMHHATEAWADGYEQALIDQEITRHVSHHELRNIALERMAERNNEAMIEALIALGKLGSSLTPRERLHERFEPGA